MYPTSRDYLEFVCVRRSVPWASFWAQTRENTVCSQPSRCLTPRMNIITFCYYYIKKTNHDPPLARRSKGLRLRSILYIGECRRPPLAIDSQHCADLETFQSPFRHDLAKNNMQIDDMKHSDQSKRTRILFRMVPPMIPMEASCSV